MNRNIRMFFASWLVLSGSAGSPTPCFADTAVTLKPTVEISRATVRLSDLFSGVPTAIDRDIAQAPPPCKPAVYSEAVLDKLADTYRLDWQPAESADHAVVTSTCSRVTGEMIRDAVVAKVKQGGDSKERTFDVAFDTRNLEVDLPADQHADFTLDNFFYDPTTKHFRTDFTAQTSRGTYLLPLTGHILTKHKVPVLARRLEAGTTISANDLDWVDLPEERVSADIITEPSQLIGRELRHDTGEGEVLRSRDVQPERLVIRGSLVTMRIETPFLTVTAQGKAEQDGGQGDTVRVTNTQSNRIVEGTVMGPGLIEIRTAQKVALAQ